MKKTKYLKKILLICFVAMFVFLNTVVFVSAEGSNNTDSKFSFTLPGTSFYSVLNSGRAKLNWTGSYISSDSVNPSEGALFSIHGYNSPTVPAGSQAVNCTKGTSARIWPGQNRRIRQYVYERGYTYAFIGASAITTAGVGKSLTGMWSPDSVGSDPYCN